MVHVLVVEDDIRLNQIVCASLRSAGYDARGCTNAAQAFDLLHADGADIIVSDIMMPGIDGFEFVADVRSVNKHIPILLDRSGCGGAQRLRRRAGNCADRARV